MLAFCNSQPQKNKGFTMHIVNRDLKHVWHPLSQMKDYETFHPLEVIAANGSHIELKSGKKVIDAISSLWCKSLGHNHPVLKQALREQMEKFEHVMLTNITYETIVQLSEKLSRLTNSLNKVFYASDGSCAVEIAMKMSIQARKICGETQRNLFVGLENAYHGETVGALSVSDIGIYRDPYQPLLFDTRLITSLPYVDTIQHPLWSNCDSAWQVIEKNLEPWCDRITAIIIEPIVQGAAGMRIYSQDFVRRLRHFTQKKGIHLIADEIMTGIGRTGKMLACEYAGIEPDFVCLSKGLTSGWLPLSAVLTTSAIYELFYADFESEKSFLHSHTFSGNALAASVALAVLTLFEEEPICMQASQLGEVMLSSMLEIADQTKKLANVRGIGAIVAADLIHKVDRSYMIKFYQKAIELGALLRPLGNTIYWLPPLTMDLDTLSALKAITQHALLCT